MYNRRESFIAKMIWVLIIIGLFIYYRDTEAQEVIEQKTLYNHTFNIFKVPQWKNDILDELGYDRKLKLLLWTINNLECGREDGFCERISKKTGKVVDVGPFQINQIHKTAFWFSRKLIRKGHKKQLYYSQADWIIDRLGRYNTKDYCNIEGISFENKIKCFLRIHNGSNTKEYFAYKGRIIYKRLDKFYK